jgi:hypothetical protein
METTQNETHHHGHASTRTPAGETPTRSPVDEMERSMQQVAQDVRALREHFITPPPIVTAKTIAMGIAVLAGTSLIITGIAKATEWLTGDTAGEKKTKAISSKM